MHMKRSLVSTLLFGGLILFGMTACSGGNPMIGSAEDALEQGNYESALSSVEEALDQDSASVEAYQLKARILRAQADSMTPPEQYASLHQRAMEAEEQAIKFNPEVRSDIQNQRRLSYIQEMQNGANAFNQARQSGDSTAFMRASAYFSAANTIMSDSADAHLNEAYARLNAGQREEAVSPMETYISKSDSVDSNVYTILGQIHLTENRPGEAMDVLEPAAEQYPENQEIQSLLLNAYSQSGDTQRAMEAYQSQIERNPENPTYRYNYGSLLLNADRFDDAIDQLSEAAQLDPDNVKAQYNLGAAYVNKAGSINDSIRTIEDSLRSSDEAEVEDETEQQLQSMAEERDSALESAIPPLEKARQLADPGNQYRQDICRALFSAYVQTDKQDQAKQVEQCAGYEEGRTEDMTGNGGQ